jgi:hypothetical protein
MRAGLGLLKDSDRFVCQLKVFVLQGSGMEFPDRALTKFAMALMGEHTAAAEGSYRTTSMNVKRRSQML